MNIVHCAVAAAPLRSEPSHRSEMVSQLLLDEAAEILEKQTDFVRLRCLYDAYEGWCAANQLDFSPRAEITASGNTVSFEAENIRRLATEYLDVPYLWGGKSRLGIDCSGFSQQVFRAMGVWLPRDAYQQAALGEVVGFLQEAIAGDLAFFDNEAGRITHVGIMLGSDKIIHASGKVRVDNIDHQGIVHAETGMRTHRLRVIKRHKKP